MKKILLLTNIPSPYMVDYLNEFGKYCELTAIFERDSSSVRDKSWKKWENKNFNSIVLHGLNLGGRDSDKAICFQVIKYIKKKYDHIIVCNPCTPTGIIAVTYMKIRKIKHGFQSEGGFPGTGKGIKERFKKFLFSNGDFYFSTAQLGDDYYKLYGATQDKIIRYPFTSLREKDILNQLVSIQDKRKIKKELGIPYDKIVLSVGRFLQCKGHDGLIKACTGLKGNVGIYIVGGNPTKEYLDLKRHLKLNSLHFVDFQDWHTIRKYYMASDVFALNTRDDTWGLVINEAMAVGLPIVTTTKCYAALAMIENGEGGYIVEPDDVCSLNKYIKLILDSSDTRDRMGRVNIDKSKYYTLENMGIVVSDALNLL